VFVPLARSAAQTPAKHTADNAICFVGPFLDLEAINMLDDSAIDKRKISLQVLLDITPSGRISTTADNSLTSAFVRVPLCYARAARCRY
jgi:hypothetical protein